MHLGRIISGISKGHFYEELLINVSRVLHWVVSFPISFLLLKVVNSYDNSYFIMPVTGNKE